jgi:hypothetical protein
VASPKTWLAIPPTALACAASALAAGRGPIVAVVLAVLGAAIAGAVRAYAGPSRATAIVAGAAGLLGALGSVELALGVRGGCAGAAAVFAIAELARPEAEVASPWPALGAALIAGVLDPAYIALGVLAAARQARGPWPRARWMIAIPIACALACVLAAAAALSRGGALASLWQLWGGHADAVAAAPARVLVLAGNAIGPIAVVAALAGLATAMMRGSGAAAGLLAAVVGALVLDLRAGAVLPATPIIAALATGVGLARLAALVRHPVGQACIGAAAGFILLVAPVWTLAGH